MNSLLQPEYIHHQFLCTWPQDLTPEERQQLPDPNSYGRNKIYTWYQLCLSEPILSLTSLTGDITRSSSKIITHIFKLEELHYYTGEVVYYWYEWRRYE